MSVLLTDGAVHPTYLAQGQRLAARRRGLGLSQQELAAAIGVNQPSVSNWEGGRRTPSTMHWLALARVLDIKLDWLMRGAW